MLSSGYTEGLARCRWPLAQQRTQSGFVAIVLHPSKTRMPDKPVAERLRVKCERRLAGVGASVAVDNMIGIKERGSEPSPRPQAGP
jgi:hypothetical protein